MGAERDNLLSGEIITLQECENSHRRNAPPVGIAQDNGVVLVHILHLGGELRTGFCTEFLFGLLDTDHIVLRVLLYRINLEDIGLREERLNLLYNNPIIAFGQVTDAAVL